MALSALAALGIAAGSQVVGNLLGSALGGVNASTQNHYSRELMRFQSELEHNENQYWADYNSPIQQMSRLKAAGLNPNLVYGNGSVAQVGGSVSPSAKSDYRPANVDFLEGINMSNLVAQNENLRQQNDLLKAQTEKERNISEGVDLDNMRKRGQNPFQYGSYESMEQHYKALNAKSENERIASSIALQKLDIFRKEIENRFENAAAYIRLDQMTTDLAIARINESYLPFILDNQLKLSQAQQGQAYATIIELGALTSYYRQLKDTSHSTQELTDTENEIKHRRKQLADLGLNPDDNTEVGAIINGLAGVLLSLATGRWKNALK